MKIQFTDKDPRRGTTANLPADQAKVFIDSGAAKAVGDDVESAQANDATVRVTRAPAKKSVAKPAKQAARKAPAKKAAKAGGK